MMQVRATTGKKRLQRRAGPRFLPYNSALGSRPRADIGHTVSAGTAAVQTIEVISPMPMYHAATRKAEVESLMWMEDPENYVGILKTTSTPRRDTIDPEHPQLGPQVTLQGAALQTSGIFLRACSQRHTDQTPGEQWRELKSKSRESLEQPLACSGAYQPNDPTDASGVNMPMSIPPTASTALMMTLAEPWYLDWWSFAEDGDGSLLPRRGGDEAATLASDHHLSALDAFGLSSMTPGASTAPCLLGSATWGY